MELFNKFVSDARFGDVNHVRNVPVAQLDVAQQYAVRR